MRGAGLHTDVSLCDNRQLNGRSTLLDEHSQGQVLDLHSALTAAAVLSVAAAVAAATTTATTSAAASG